ncbi:hypothetical protein Taro_044262 [Colocasia esculenta]|uniref:Secreted protein n=1 Tax=Colocasia esculenta TaxID=4460 RepID=A0A843X2C8_COLES|nr:hypothetical protein [Colocasia esculenta]
MKWCVPLCLHGLCCGIPCEASARSREADSDQVRYRFNGLERGILSHGGVIVELEARRRWPFRREGPNGSALLLEVRLLNSGRTCTGRKRWGGSRRPRT